MPTRRKAVLAAEAKPTWLLALDDDLLRSIAAFLPMPTLVDFTAVQRRFSNCFTESGWLSLAGAHGRHQQERTYPPRGPGGAPGRALE